MSLYTINDNNNNRRPISPHLQIYKLPLTAVLSITHRITGVFLTISSIILMYWLGSLVSGLNMYIKALNFFNTFIGKSILFLITLNFIYHMLNGIRHLAWDFGYGFKITTVHTTGWLVIIGSIFLTILIWLI